MPISLSFKHAIASLMMTSFVATSTMLPSIHANADIATPQVAKDNDHIATTEHALSWQRTLPDKIFEGYWAATEMIGGMGVVLKYEPNGIVTLHQYDCNRPYRPNVSVKPDHDTRMRLIPTDDNNVINVYSYSRQRINSQIQNIQIIGNMLDLEQVFVTSRPKLTVPYTYKHSHTLTPICNHDKRKK